MRKVLSLEHAQLTVLDHERTKLRLFCAAFLLIALTVPQAARADDFFSQEEKTEEEAASSDGSGFTILNAFGADGSAATDPAAEKPKSEHRWAEFEDVSGTEIEKKFLKSGEVRLFRELRKPLPQRSPFGDPLDNLEDSVEGLRPPNVVESMRNASGATKTKSSRTTKSK